MADEYIAHLKNSKHQHLMLAKGKLLQTRRYDFESEIGATVKLRYSSQQRRDQWPEDITLELDNGAVLATIHAGSREQRSEVIRDLEMAFRDQGFDEARFEET